ncbi:MAG: ABC transporter ATP-binding protein [Elusimicrobia bacterium]|nr:ABC transporter ATP-binding protein [Elusimicrobiota bacterium]
MPQGLTVRRPAALLRSALSLAIVLLSPGLAPYEALANTVAVSAASSGGTSVFNAAGAAARSAVGAGPVQISVLPAGLSLKPALSVAAAPSVKSPAAPPLVSAAEPLAKPGASGVALAAQAADLAAPLAAPAAVAAVPATLGLLSQALPAQAPAAAKGSVLPDSRLSLLFDGSIARRGAEAQAGEAVAEASPAPSHGSGLASPARGRLAAGARVFGHTVAEMFLGEAKFASLTRPYRGRMILARLILVFQAVMGTALAYSTGAFIDAALAHAAPVALGWFLGMAALTGARILVSRYHWVLLERIKVRMRQDLRMAFFEHVQRLPASFGRRGDPPEITMRLLNDVARVMTKNVDIPVNTPMLVIQLVMAAGFVLHTSLPLAVGILVSLPLLAYLSARFGGKLAAQQQRLAALQADLTRLGQDLFSGNRDARASGGDGHAASVYRGRSGVYEALLLEIAKLSSGYAALRDFLQTAFSEFLILGAGFMSFILTGSPSVGQIMSLRGYANDLRGAFSGILDRYNDGRSADGGLSRVHELREAPAAAPDKPGARDFAGSEVSFRALSYTLPGQGEVLRNVDFSAAPGERVLVVGGEAAARRSLIDLLLRLDSPRSGSVRTGGADVADLKRDGLIAHISLVAGDAAAFSGTLRQNLLFGIARQVSDEELTAALRAAGAACLLDAERLPQGLDTLVEDESGTSLDTEQLQRLALARAVLKDPAVLIAEDLGLGLDTRVAGTLRRDFERLARGRTTLVFAGQPERAEGYDRIVVLHDGKVVESGTHAELMALGGRYREMVESSGPKAPSN